MCTTRASKSISQRVCHQRQLNWFACLFVISPVFAVAGRGRTRLPAAWPAEQWASNSSLRPRRACGAALIYFHSATRKTVGSGYSNVFINLPRWAGASSKTGCCGNWRGEETHGRGGETQNQPVPFFFFPLFWLSVLIYGAVLTGPRRRVPAPYFYFNLPATPVFVPQSQFSADSITKRLLHKSVGAAQRKKISPGCKQSGPLEVPTDANSCAERGGYQWNLRSVARPPARPSCQAPRRSGFSPSQMSNPNCVSSL